MSEGATDYKAARALVDRLAAWGPSRVSLHAAIVLVVCLALVGCSAPARTVLTDAQHFERAGSEDAVMVASLTEGVGRLIDRIESRAASSGGATTINFLAMSGGGDYGAFGAGFLVGWGDVEDPEWARPDFDVVSGVSTGALLAPFAYLGDDESLRTVETFYRNPRKDWVLSRGPLYFLPSNPSFMEIRGLVRDVDGVIDEAFIRRMAEESRAGKLLMTSATDLDLGRQRFWSLGVEAEEAVESGHFGRMHRILLASAAIPAAFPPIEIDGGLYADGGVTANVLVKLDARSPYAFIPRWRAANPDKPLPRVRYWVIINNKIRHIPETVQERWPSVAVPSLEIAIRSATLAEVRWLASEANYVNLLFDADIEVRVVSIPDDWRPPVEGDFMKETMESLSDLGREMGADPRSWAVWASPEIARSPLGVGAGGGGQR